MDQNNTKSVMINIIILFVFWNIIKLEPTLSKYKENVRFNMYRSLICLTFAGFSLQNTINHFTPGFLNPFKYHTNDFDEIHDLFIAYLILDIIKLISEGNKRFELYLHHFWCLLSFIIAKLYGYCGFFHNFLLFNEVISIVSGIDAMALNEPLEKNDYIRSMKCKKIRKNIIKYIRLPVWIILFIFTINYTNNLPKILWLNGITSTLIMIYLDKYWEKKCDKVINKYKKK